MVDGSRRKVLGTMGGVAAASLLPAPWVHAAQTFKIGYVAPATGPLSVFAEPDPFTLEAMKKSGYLTEDLVIELATRAGFRLDARSEVNANAKDTADHPNGVWTLPPTNRNDGKDVAKYRAIGESDRMTLRFVKPHP